MTIAKILLPVAAASDPGASADVAFALASRFDAHVEGLHPVRPAYDRIYVTEDAGAPTQLKQMLEAAKIQVEQEQKRAGKAFAEAAGRHPGTKSSFEAVEGDVAAIIAQRGRLADLTAVPAVTRDESPFWSEAREGALFQTGRPIVVAPRGAVSDTAGETVVIGWKDSVETARALTAAKPFLAKAKSVRVVTIGTEAYEKQDLEKVAAYLALAGLKAKAELIAPGKRDTGEALVEEAAKSPGALLVMGAYSQWRWREWVFGGVTEYVLHNTQVPALMTH